MSRPPSETDIERLGQGRFGFVVPDSSRGSDCKQTFPDVHVNSMHADARRERMPRSLGSKIKQNALTSTGWGERSQSRSKSGGLAWSNAPSPHRERARWVWPLRRWFLRGPLPNTELHASAQGLQSAWPKPPRATHATLHRPAWWTTPPTGAAGTDRCTSAHPSTRKVQNTHMQAEFSLFCLILKCFMHISNQNSHNYKATC